MIKILNNQSGQMFVETAVVLPIVLVIALIVINLFKFANLIASVPPALTNSFKAATSECV